MLRGFIKVEMLGILGRDPEMRYTPSGRAVTSFSVVASRSWTTADGERREHHEWVNIVAWGKLAEICKTHLKKDQQVYVEGRLQTRRWTNDEGKQQVQIEVVADDMYVVGERRMGIEYADADESAHDDGDYPF
ncbi:MAG: single-stranded DNA-binding protein [Anaerolineales bacterium]|nr:single-stranded DNA-binding protein [Anaerolineales bacterium]